MRRLPLAVLLLLACDGGRATTLDPAAWPVARADEPVEQPAEPLPDPFTPGCLSVVRTVTLPAATVRCGATSATVAVRNDCLAGVALSGRRQGAFGFGALPSLPVGTSRTITIGFAPDAPGPQQTQLVLTARANGASLDVPLDVRGEGLEAGTAAQEFIVTAPPPQEVLVIVDDDVPGRDAQLGELALALTQYPSRVVVTNLAGEVQQPDGVEVLPSESVTFATRFVRAARVAPTTGVTRSCVATVQRLLAERRPAGFWQPDTWRSVVCVTNALDGVDAPASHMVGGWPRLFDGRPTPFLLAAPLVDGRCGPVDPRLMTLSTTSFGTQEDLCVGSLARVVFDSQVAAFGRNTLFRLEANVDAASLRVTVNDVEVPRTVRGATAWEYDGALNAVRFMLLSAPSPGDRLRVSWSTCQ